jgi:hypothetical protein
MFIICTRHYGYVRGNKTVKLFIDVIVIHCSNKSNHCMFISFGKQTFDQMDMCMYRHDFHFVYFKHFVQRMYDSHNTAMLCSQQRIDMEKGTRA